jgi:hypothetical protein
MGGAESIVAAEVRGRGNQAGGRARTDDAIGAGEWLGNLDAAFQG